VRVLIRMSLFITVLVLACVYVCLHVRVSHDACECVISMCMSTCVHACFCVNLTAPVMAMAVSAAILGGPRLCCACSTAGRCPHFHFGDTHGMLSEPAR